MYMRTGIIVHLELSAIITQPTEKFCKRILLFRVLRLCQNVIGCSSFIRPSFFPYGQIFVSILLLLLGLLLLLKKIGNARPGES